MPRRENYYPLLSTATLLTIAIVIVFQIYQMREPARLVADAAADLEKAVEAGQELYAANCISCHGENGEGSMGPALNTKDMRESVNEEQIFGLVKTGVPGTSMPAWAQAFGGPFTDEEARQVVEYIQSWEPLSDEVSIMSPEPDKLRGAEIFGSICIVCHGVEGFGTDIAPALNDTELLNSFDDEWFRDTITSGRPSQGMPTWGTVLSPSEIDDVVALLAAWREGESVSLSGDGTFLTDSGDALVMYEDQCAVCHGAEGEGGIAPALRANKSIMDQSNETLFDLILNGRPGTSMPGFEGRLNQSEIQTILALLLEWQR
jgi:mono/diheme cytochrome c family protein